MSFPKNTSQSYNCAEFREFFEFSVKIPFFRLIHMYEGTEVHKMFELNIKNLYSQKISVVGYLETT